MSGRELSVNEICRIGEKCVGKSFYELGYQSQDTVHKSVFGHFIEDHVFGYQHNNDSNPDFKEAEVELKVTPYKKNKNGTYSAKERLVLNIINYETEHHLRFEESSFYRKNKRLYLMFYQYIENIPIEEFLITSALLYDYSEQELEQIREDWGLIVKKIEDGKAHELSESDTMYLGACTKGTNRLSTRSQPFSPVPAKQRAYCLKQSFMTHFLRTKVLNKNFESIIPLTQKATIEDYIQTRLKSYIGKSCSEIFSSIGEYEPSSKGKYDILVSRMLGIKGRVGNTEEFAKANIISKTIRVEPNGRIKEHMSFPAFDFNKLVNEDWDTSELRDYFESTKFLFSVFQRHDSEYIYCGSLFWNMPINILDTQVRKVWEKTKKVLISGNIVSHLRVDGRTTTNFPKIKDNPICHVRPHGVNAKDTTSLPVKDVLTGRTSFQKQCFWIDSRYIATIVGVFLIH